MKMKKGQVTLFIITGIVILLITGLLYAFLGSDVLKAGPPENIKSVVVYTEQCIENTADEGTMIQKMQGGYIKMPERLSRAEAYINMGFSVPYWYYDRMDYMPSKYRMEKELAQYIDENLDRCLEDYKVFSQYEIESETPDSDVTIASDEIQIITNYPLKIKELAGDKVHNWKEFRVDKDDKLGKLHSLAKDIMEYENEEYFLEDYTDEMIASSDYLPFEGMFMECKPEVYHQQELEEYTQTLIMHNLNFLQFENTDYTETGIPYYDKLYKVDFTNNNYNEMSVKAIYNPEWGMDFKALPTENGVVKSFNYKAYNFLQTCIQIFHHRYNVEYPVMFQITDTQEPDESFQFATPVFLKRNQPNRDGTVEPWESEVKDLSASEKYCERSEEATSYELENNQINTRETTVSNWQNELNVYAVDALEGWPEGAMAGVNISYQCVEARCPVGNTSHKLSDGLVMPGSTPYLEAKFPDCMNGIIVAEKDGYHTALNTQTVSSETDGSQVTIDMYKLKPFDYEVRVVEDHNGVISERRPEDEESVLITLKNKEERFEKTVMYPAEEGYLHNLSLLRGDFDYDLEILMTEKNSLVGGANMTWSPEPSKIINNENVVFYVFKKDPMVPPSSIDEVYELYNESLEKSVDYPPRFR